MSEPPRLAGARSENGRPDSGSEVRHERPHPLTPLVRGWVLLFAALLGFGRELIPKPGEKVPPWWVLLGIVALVAVAVALGAVVTWWTTRFVIDDRELRVETGWLRRNSKRVPFGRIQSIDVIQPLAARLFGLCELRIEAGAGHSGVTLRYLSRAKAYALRDFLLARAHGDATTRAEAEAGPQASAFEDLAVHDQILVRLDPGVLVLGLVTSTEFVVGAALLMLGVAVTAAFGEVLAAAGSLVPLAVGLTTIIGHRVVAQFNYTLARTGRGLRVTRGLTNLTSQSIPVDRVQGIRVRQPLIWRALNLHRVDIDVLGYGHKDDTNNKSAASSMLLPVARPDQVRAPLAFLLPGEDTEAITLWGVPRRALWVSPIGQPALRHGFDDRVLISDSGRIDRQRLIVPHDKAQSVRLTQGPIQRLLRLVNVHIDTTPGPVTMTVRHVDEQVGRTLLDDELARAAKSRTHRRPDPYRPDTLQQ